MTKGERRSNKRRKARYAPKVNGKTSVATIQREINKRAAKAGRKK